MKNILKKRVVALVLGLMIASHCVIPSFAAELPFNATPDSAEVITNGDISSLSNSYPYIGRGLYTTTSWQTVASSTTGFGCNVFIKCSNTAMSGWTVVPCNIRMLGKNGNVIWEEDGAIPGLGSRIFICGKDVYTIQICTQKGNGSAWAWETTEPAN